MKLTKVHVLNYKCIEDQEFHVTDDITILVGMNESGKTAILQSIAKSNYFQDDKDFKYDKLHDFPRKSLKSKPKEFVPDAIKCTYEMDENDKAELRSIIGNCIKNYEVTVQTDYEGRSVIGCDIVDANKFFRSLLDKHGLYSKLLLEKLLKLTCLSDIDRLYEEYKEESYRDFISSLKEYFSNSHKWKNNALNEYVYRTWIDDKLPRFIYYDEYYSLPSRICIEDIQSNANNTNDMKTARALIELANVDVAELKKANNYETLVAELESTEAIISEILFKYWTNSGNRLRIKFSIEHIESNNNQGHQIIQHYLNVRVMNTHYNVSLPLGNRSKGFNWFFSFLVWFNKIQEDKSKRYVLLLDEPGLNLHASAQSDLLRFLEDLSATYQIIYTTHSPFMIPTDKLFRVRTVLETDSGSKISESTQEKDPNTLFPLQAALGYDIAQNLFIGQHNLIVEGISDLVYLNVMSNCLKEMKRECLNDKITIMPVGGLDKVASFVSLLRGNNLNMVCLLDTFNDNRSKDRLENLVKAKIINDKNILFYHEFIDNHESADIEDMFDPTEYVSLFNRSFGEEVDIDKIDPEQCIIPQISKLISRTFNHYSPANILAISGVNGETFGESTIKRFEVLFDKINKRFGFK